MRGEVADAEPRAERLGEAADVDDAVELVELGDAVGAARVQVGEDVVLDDVEVVRLGEPQHPERVGGAERGAGRVVQHRVGHEELRLVLLRERLEALDVEPVAAARHADRPHAHRGEMLEEGLAARGFVGPVSIMKSNGGRMLAATTGGGSVQTVLSGTGLAGGFSLLRQGTVDQLVLSSPEEIGRWIRSTAAVFSTTFRVRSGCQECWIKRR